VENEKDTPALPMEAALMAALDTIWQQTEKALGYIQDDGRMSGPADKREILRCMHVIEVQVSAIRSVLHGFGEHSSVGESDSD
jgi:hypothetical protein